MRAPKRVMLPPREEDEARPAGPVTVVVNSGLELARRMHEAAIEIGPSFGIANRDPVPFDDIPARQREHLVASCEHLLRKLELEQYGGGRAAKA